METTILTLKGGEMPNFSDMIPFRWPFIVGNYMRGLFCASGVADN